MQLHYHEDRELRAVGVWVGGRELVVILLVNNCGGMMVECFISQPVAGEWRLWCVPSRPLSPAVDMGTRRYRCR